ncbi:MAG: NusG domain II-containing protein [Gammaproteobacteria bacterium]|nr:NusG domain II-containing protein [Gammaproteobacteria bacterium]
MSRVKLSRGDAVVWLLAAILLVGLYMVFWQADGHGAEAVVLVNGKRWARLDLFQNQDLDVPGPLGHSYIQVRDGQVRFVDSPCPNKLCVHTGWLNQGGEVAICLPNKVSLQILASDPRFDTINF